MKTRLSHLPGHQHEALKNRLMTGLIRCPAQATEKRHQWLSVLDFTEKNYQESIKRKKLTR